MQMNRYIFEKSKIIDKVLTISDLKLLIKGDLEGNDIKYLERRKGI